MCIAFTDSMVDFADRHDTRAAIQRRYKVRRKLDPVRHENFKKYHRDYMKKWQLVSRALNFFVKNPLLYRNQFSVFLHLLKLTCCRGRSLKKPSAVSRHT